MGWMWKRGPDTALSWVIAVASCILFMVIFGTNRANGILFLGLRDRYPETSREALSWPFQLVGFSGIFAAPLTGFLSTRFADRSIVIVGTLLFSLGSIVCFFSTEHIFVSIFFGILRGTGLAMGTTAVPSLIGKNFKRHKATAMGIATSGTPIGGFFFPILLQYCLEEYGLKGAFLLLGGMSLHAAIGALALVEYQYKRPTGIKPPATNIEMLELDVRSIFPAPLNTVEPCTIKSYKGIDNEAFNWNLRGYESENKTILHQKDQLEHTDTENNVKPLPVDQVGSLVNAGQEKENASQVFNIELQDEQSLVPADDKPKTLNMLKNIFTSRGFYYLTITNLAITFFLGSYTLLIVDYGMDKGMEKSEAVYLLSCTSIGEIVGRLCLGWITDRKLMSRPVYLVFTLLITGVMVTTLALTTDFTVLLASAIIFGGSQGTALNVANVMYTDYLKKEEVLLAFAFTRSLIGLSFIPRASLIGVFRDKMGTYDYYFHLMGCLFYLSALTWLIEWFVQRRNLKGSSL